MLNQHGTLIFLSSKCFQVTLSCYCYRLQTMRRVGILKGIYNHFSRKLRYAEDDTKLFVDLHDTAPLFIILATGILFSLTIFIVFKYGSRCHILSYYINRHQIACLKVIEKSYNVATQTVEPRRVKIARNSQRSNSVLVT